MANHNIKVTEGIYKAVRALLKDGSTDKEVCEYFGIGKSTVNYIKKCETYEEYKHTVYVSSSTYKKRMAAIKAKEKEKAEEKTEEKVSEEPKDPPVQVVEHRQSVTVVANHYMMEELKMQTELLKTISAKLLFIVDELTK